MAALGPALALLLAAASPSPSARPSPAAAPATEQPVILFLVDNSASLPPLDPEEKRVAALEKMFTFLQGRPYRLILFGGRKEVYVDDVTRYRNNGQWTDYYAAFEKARETMASYPKGTEFRIILVTDAIPDPNPEDWEGQMAPNADLKAVVSAKTIALIRDMASPLYVILVGEMPPGEVGLDAERSPGLILEMVRAANGMQATPLAQSLSGFFGDNGVLLKKFIYRVAPTEGLKKVEPVVKRIVAPPQPGVELRMGTALLLPLVLFMLLLVGLLVRSFPGAGDTEVVEMKLGQPVHLAADRPHKLESGGWASGGLALVGDARDAVATLSYQSAVTDMTGSGLSMADPDPLTVQLLPLGLEELRRELERYSTQGSKEEKIYALNMEYIARSFDPKEAERLLTTAPSDRSRIAALDFLRSKVYLLSDGELRRRITEPHTHILHYGKDASRKDLIPSSRVRIGPYGFTVKDITRGGRKDARVILQYDRIPSLFGIKSWMPRGIQRVCRFRRSSERVVC